MVYAFQTRDAGRAGVYPQSEAGTPDMTIERADADHARPYLRRPPSGSVLLFLGLHTQKQRPSGQSFFRTLLGQIWNLSAVRQYGDTVDLDQNFD
jgi:hypothetical protein